MDNLLRKVQQLVFTVDDRIGILRLYKLGNRIQDFRTKHTLKRGRRTMLYYDHKE